HELGKRPAIDGEAHDDRAQHQAREHRQPADPARLARKVVIAGDARDHDRDRSVELHLVRGARVLNFDLVCHINPWQARRESNPQPAVLETAALPIELLAYSIWPKSPQAISAEPTQHSEKAASERRGFRSLGEPVRLAGNTPSYLRILVTTPAPTVLPPSRIAKRSPSSIAIGLIRSIVILMLSPGITISTPAGSSMVPVTSVVRK